MTTDPHDHDHGDPRPVLDDDLVALVSASFEPDPIAAPAAGPDRAKARLLRRIAADTTDRHLTAPPLAADWQPFGEGVSIKVLHEAGGIMSYLLRLAPGAALGAHRHPVDEECVVLEGEVQIGHVRLGAGGFHLGRKDVLHDRLCSTDGALIFLRGAIPEADLLV